jgi:ribosomal protein L11 methyltransferase
VEAATANARRNGLARRIRVRRGSLPTGEPPFDVVVANLIASLLVALAAELRDELGPSGVILASGIFVDREQDVRTTFEAVGLAITRRSAEGDWVALTAERTSIGRPRPR